MNLKACPDEESLRQLLLGKLSGSQAEHMEEHLLHCDGCLSTADTISARDELTVAIQAPDFSCRDEDEDVLAEAIERAKQLHSRSETMDTGETRMAVNLPRQKTASEAPANRSEDSPDEKFDFLAPPQQPDEIGRLGDYRVLDVMGVGGMGVVFRAEDPKLKRQIALKAMKPAVAASRLAKERFVREAQATAAIEHDNIVAIYQVGEDRGVPFIAMPFLRGESLQTRLKRKKQFDQRDVLRIGREVAAGLAAAHERGLIHRDIKPDNIWIEAKTGRAKILDFGLVRQANDDDSGLTQTGMVVGTPKYMAPEQAHGQSVDHRCDLFSLGSVLYHLATGKPPFAGGNITATLIAVVQNDPDTVASLCPEIDADLSQLIMRLLSKAPEQRPQSASEVAEMLAAIEQKLVEHEKTPPNAAMAQASGAQASGAQTRELLVNNTLPTINIEQKPRVKRRPHLESKSRKRISLSGLVGLAAAFAAAIAVLVIQTDKGTIKIVSNDPRVEVTVRRSGKVADDFQVTQRAGGASYYSGKYEIVIKGGNADGFAIDKNSFTLTRGKEVVVTITKVIGNRPKTLDRRAAEWVLSMGGTVGCWDSQSASYQRLEDLPTELLLLHTIDFHGNHKVTDNALRFLRGLKHLESLNLTATSVTGAGLENIAGCTSLTGLNLGETSIDGQAMRHLAKLERLTYLNLSFTNVTDAGFQHLAHLQNLSRLYATSTPSGDAGLEHIKGLTELTQISAGEWTTDEGLKHLAPMKNLTALGLAGSQVTGAGLVHLHGLKNLTVLRWNASLANDRGLRYVRGIPNLRELILDGTKITAVGLSHLKDLPLTKLGLSYSPWTDADLKHLESLQQLQLLTLINTQVSAVGVAELQKALPLCKIEWDGNLLEPEAKADNSAPQKTN